MTALAIIASVLAALFALLYARERDRAQEYEAGLHRALAGWSRELAARLELESEVRLLRTRANVTRASVGQGRN